jgi:small neutral amino acid transporter SnatA (MarC family)
MNYTFASATILLLLITDPFGNIPIFANALRPVAPERRARVILREVLIAFGLLLTFMFVGDRFLRLMNLSDLSLQMAGGVVLFLIALRMIFPPPPAEGAVQLGEPLIVPLAIPALAGPSALATVMLLVSQAPERRLEWVAALSVTMVGLRRGAGDGRTHPEGAGRPGGDGLRAVDGPDPGRDLGRDDDPWAQSAGQAALSRRRLCAAPTLSWTVRRWPGRSRQKGFGRPCPSFRCGWCRRTS